MPGKLACGGGDHQIRFRKETLKIDSQAVNSVKVSKTRDLIRKTSNGRTSRLESGFVPFVSFLGLSGQHLKQRSFEASFSQTVISDGKWLGGFGNCGLYVSFGMEN